MARGDDLDPSKCFLTVVGFATGGLVTAFELSDKLVEKFGAPEYVWYAIGTLLPALWAYLKFCRQKDDDDD